MNSSKIVKSSNRPAIIRKARNIVVPLEYRLKFDVGPTNSKPGPTLPMQVAAELAAVIKSTFSKETMKVPKRNREIYKKMKLTILDTV